MIIFVDIIVFTQDGIHFILDGIIKSMDKIFIYLFFIYLWTVLGVMFTDNDRNVAYVLCGAVLVVCLVTLYSVHKTRMDILERMDEICRQNCVMLPEKESLLSPSMSYSATQDRVAPK